MSGPRNLEELNELASRPTQGVLDTLRQVDGDVLVLGAGGKMGFHLALMLRRALDAIDSTNEIFAVSRFEDESVAKKFESHSIRAIRKDLLRKAAMEELPDAKAVFFLAGIKFGTSADPQLLQATNVDLPARVCERYCECPIVALSTGCVYPFANVESRGSIESDTLGGMGDYAVSCIGRERSFVQSPGTVSLIRLNYSTDLQYGVLVDIARNVIEGHPVDVSTGYFNTIWQGDANLFIIRSLLHTASPPNVLNVTGSQILAVRKIAKMFADRFDKRLTIIGNENRTAWLSNANRCFELFGYPTVSEGELVEWVASWLMRGGNTLDKPTHFEVRDGKF